MPRPCPAARRSVARSAASRAHRIRVLWAAAHLAGVSLELRLRASTGTVRLLGTLSTEAPVRPVTATQLAEARRVAFAVARAADRLPWHPTCLRQAVALQRMLRRRGIACRLEIGMSTSSREAHAWVTVHGQTVIGHRAPGSLVSLAGFD